MVHKISHKQEAEGQTDPEGAGKNQNSNKGCLQQSLDDLAYRELGTENDQRSDG